MTAMKLMRQKMRENPNFEIPYAWIVVKGVYREAKFPAQPWIPELALAVQNAKNLQMVRRGRK
jgi:hypothetical protein